LKVFESAANNESFASAAQELYLTASAVSHQIKILESHLGVKLFTRKKRKVELTPIGEKYLTSIKQAFNEIEVATQRIENSSGTDIVTISVAPNFLVRWLMPRMKSFQRQYPDVELQISASTGLIDFSKTNVDMAIYFGHGDWHDITVHFLNHVYLVPVCSPRLLDSEHPLNEPKDLKQHTLIHVTKRLHEWPEWLEIASIKNKRFGGNLRLSSSQLATAAAQEGLGVALGDSTLSSREIAQGKLIMPFDIQLDTHKSFYLVYQKDRPVSYGMQAFKDWVIEEMQLKTSKDAYDYSINKNETPNPAASSV
jgi:LysR family glycine cleavage system transcriptional activator